MAARTRNSSRQALVAAAWDEFLVKGYESATLAGIADRAGVTTGAIYAHFPSKVALLVEVIGLHDVGRFWREMAAVADLPWTEAAERLSQPMTASVAGQAALVVDLIAVARHDPDVAGTLREGLSTYLDVARRAGEEGVAAGLIDPAVDLDDLARILIAVSLGTLALDALGQRPPSRRALVRLTDLLLQGSRSDPAEPAVLSRVRSRRRDRDRDERRLHRAMAEAADEGHSLRRIGEAAGLSHEQVRRILEVRRHEM